MQKTVFKIKKIEIEDFRPKEAFSVMKISYSKNEELQQINKQFSLAMTPEELVNKIISEIKGQNKAIIEESDDILENIAITRIDNEEEIEDKMLFFFQNLCHKFSKLKMLKNAPDYMRLYDEIKITKLVL